MLLNVGRDKNEQGREWGPKWRAEWDRDKNEQGGGWNLKGELNLGVMKARKKGLWAKGRV